MSEPRSSVSGADPEVHRKRGPSLVWLIPVVALAIGAGVAWETLANKGPTITLVFRDGSGLEAGKTRIEYRDVEIGTVADVSLSDDLQSVIATAELSKEVEPLLTEGTVFWKVSPRVSLEGISGLGTLVSGQYITMLPGPGEPKREFAILEEPPLTAEHRGALGIELTAEDIGSLAVGSPVSYRGDEVGLVEKYELLEGDRTFRIHVLIDRPYAHLVRKGSQFWNASGLDVSLGSGGVEVRTASLVSLLEGGIAFSTPPFAESSPAAADGDRFHLFSDAKSLDRARERTSGLNISVEAQGGGVAEGAPVYYRKQRVGHVGASALSADATSVRYPVHIDARYAPLVRINSRFWNASGVSVHVGVEGVDLRTDSLESILEGALEFATPDRPGARAQPGALFALHAEPKEEWLAWAPSIWIDASEGERTVAHVLPSPRAKPAGLEIVLEAFSSGSVKKGDPIYYREVKVGEIGEHELSADAKTVRIHARIEPKYADLVRSNSRFWNASGISAHLGLGGLEVRTESLESLMAGGVAFATPDDPGDPVEPLTVFPLHPKAEDAWLRWSPALWAGGAASGQPVEHAIDAETHAHLFGDEPVASESVAPESDVAAGPEATSPPAQEAERPSFWKRIFGGG